MQPQNLKEAQNAYDQNVTLTPESYITGRVDFKIETYRKKGDRYRWSYITMASAASIGAATVPVLINLPDVPTIAPTLLSLLVTILVGLEGILHFREHWRNYDLVKTFLRQEKDLFRAGAGPYRKKSEEDANEAFRLFVERVETEIANERSQTIEIRTTPVKTPPTSTSNQELSS